MVTIAGRPGLVKDYVRQLTTNWRTYILLLAMPAPKADLRLPPILHAYLDDLAKLGAYGKGKTGVMRRFIEDGIQRALADKVIAARTVDEFDGDGEDETGREAPDGV